MAWVGGLGRISNETVLARACPKHFRFMHDFMHWNEMVNVDITRFLRYV